MREKKTRTWKETTKEAEDIVRTLNEVVLSKVTQQESLKTKTPQLSQTAVTGESTSASTLRQTVEKRNRLKRKSESKASSTGKADQQPLSTQRAVKRRKETQYNIPKKMQDQIWSKLSTYHYDSSDSKDYFISVWDFGGQFEILPTHHLFLDVEPVNIIVIDITKELYVSKKDVPETSENVMPKTPAEFLRYWLNPIHTKALQKNLSPNIVLVLTHKDMIHSSDHQIYIESYITKLRESIDEVYSTYISEKSICIVDNTHDDFNSLRDKLFKMITEQKSWGIERPTKWLGLEAAILDKAKEDTARYLKLSTVKEIASSNGILDSELERFLEFHHMMGGLFCQSDDALRNYVITDPQWLVDMLKTLIIPHEFLDKRPLEPVILKRLKQGVVSRETLQVLWKDNDVDFLVELLKKFNLILSSYPPGSTEKIFIIPCMLPQQNLNMYERDPFNKMTMIYNAFHSVLRSEGVPVGTYHKLLCHCANATDWKLCDDHFTYTDSSFEIQEGVRLVMTLMTRDKHTLSPRQMDTLVSSPSIRVSVWTKNDVDIGRVLPKLRKILAELLPVLSIEQADEFLVPCPHLEERDEYPCLVKISVTWNQDNHESGFLLQDDRCPGHRKIVSNEDFRWLISNDEIVSLSVLTQSEPVSVHPGSCMLCPTCTLPRSSITVIILGQLHNLKDINIATVKMKSFLCGASHCVDDFRQVGTSS